MMRFFPVTAAALVMMVGGLVAGQANYCEFTPQHTMCRYQGGPGRSCGPLQDQGLEPREQDQVVQYHNRSDEFFLSSL